MTTSVRQSKAKRRAILRRVTKGGRYKSQEEMRAVAGDATPGWRGSWEPTDEEWAEFIVCYFNGTDIEDTQLDLIKSFPRGFGRGLFGIANAVFITYPLALPERIEHGNDDWMEPLAPGLPPIPPGEFRSVERAVKELQAKRKHFCEAVTWLCQWRDAPVIASPPHPDFATALSAAKQEIKTILAGLRAPKTTEDQKYRRYFEQHGIDHLHKSLDWAGDRFTYQLNPRHIIDLFCSFLIDGAESGHALMPVKLCRKCGKLFSCVMLSGRARQRKQYCSARCQNEKYWGPRRTDYRYVERLSDYSPRNLRDRLNETKVQERLQEIERRWSDSPGMVERIRRLRKSAAGRGSAPAKQ